MVYLIDAEAYLPFGFAAVLIFLVIYELRLRVRNEQVSWFHRMILLLLGLYFTVIFALTVSPVYGFSISRAEHKINLTPFQVLDTMISNPMNFWGNILMFVPFGVLAVLLSRRCQKLYIPFFMGAGLSLLIEVLQLFGTRGTDIDDIILNTIGALCGYFAGRFILFIAPSLYKKIGVLKRMDNKNYRKRKDAGSIAALTVFVLISVYAVGFSIKQPDIPGIQQLVSYNPVKDSGAANSPANDPGTENNIKNSPKPTQQIEKDTLTISEELQAKNAYLWNVSSNTVLYEKESDRQIAPASTAKMLTALTVLDYCDENDEVLVGEEIKRIAADASRAWLYSGNRLTIRQLLDALLLPSGNDAAYALAVFTGRKLCGDDTASIDEALADFAAAMNEKAADIGAVHSNFVSPDGYDADGQYTTAYDLACIADAFMDSDILRDIAGSQRISDVWLSGQEVTYNNTNELLNPDSPYFYEFASGLKTGSSESAGSCLVSCAYIEDELYICVVMGSTDEGRWQDSLLLYDAVSQ